MIKMIYTLMKMHGKTPDLFQTQEKTDTELLGEFWTLNIPEHPIFHTQCPKEDAVSSLSDILEIGNVPRRYYLSQKACQGILNRSERKGKKLPEMLHNALINQMGNAPLEKAAEENAATHRETNQGTLF